MYNIMILNHLHIIIIFLNVHFYKQNLLFLKNDLNLVSLNLYLLIKYFIIFNTYQNLLNILFLFHHLIIYFLVLYHDVYNYNYVNLLMLILFI